jgi:hypothetical protein
LKGHDVWSFGKVAEAGKGKLGEHLTTAVEKPPLAGKLVSDEIS